MDVLIGVVLVVGSFGLVAYLQHRERMFWLKITGNALRQIEAEIQDLRKFYEKEGIRK